MWLSKDKYYKLVDKVCKVDQEIGFTDTEGTKYGYGIKHSIGVLRRCVEKLGNQDCKLIEQQLEIAEQLKVIKEHLGIKVEKVNQPETIYKVEELND